MNGYRVLLLTSKGEAGLNVTPPLGLYRLQFYLEERGIACDVLDLDLHPHQEALEQVAKGRYALVGMSVSHFQIDNDLEVLWQFRRAAEKAPRKILFAAGGQEAALNYAQWLKAGVELILLGFAEEVLFQVCQRHAGGNEKFSDLDGVAYLDESGAPVYRPAPPMSREEFRRLNYEQVLKLTMPFQDYWDRVRADRVDSFGGEGGFTIETVRLYTSSHCPRRCGFCSSQNFFPMSQDKKSPILMISAEEIYDLILNHIDKYGAKAFLFNDDDFPIGNREGMERLERLCDLVADAKEQGVIPKETRFICQGRIADFLMRGSNGSTEKAVNTDLLDRMARAGFNNLGLGVETFSERLLYAPSINKKVAARDCHRVLEALLERGMTPQVYIIIGIPESEPDDLVESLDAAVDYLRRGCDVGVVPQLRAYPGSPLVMAGEYEIAEKSWTHPETGEELSIIDLFVPGDPLMAKVALNIRQEAKKELDRVVAENHWDGTTIWPKSLIGMASFMAAARLLERPALHAKYQRFVDEGIAAAKDRSP